MKQLLLWCGLGHLILGVGSILIPRLLQWTKHLAHLQPLLRQMFWTYAAYILAVNMLFGVISIYGQDELLNGSFLAETMTLFISVYWAGRVGVQFLYFDRSQAPKGALYTVAEAALISLFILFTAVYTIAFLFNNSWI